MSKVFAGIIFVLLVIGYFLWSENTRLSALNQAFELRDQEQKLAIESLQNDFKTQTEGLLTIQSKNQAIELEMNRYLPKVNKGTKNVFDSIEEDSRNIDDLDDGLQLQPNS